METSNEVNELFAALSKAQGQMNNAKKTCNNPFFKSKYADLSEVWDAVRKPLTDNGLSVIQAAETSEGDIVVRTRLAHSSGQWLESPLSVKLTKQDPQSIGSAITYLRRYAVAAICGVAQEDDDGNAACQPQQEQEKQYFSSTRGQILDIEKLENERIIPENKIEYVKEAIAGNISYERAEKAILWLKSLPLKVNEK